MGKQSAQAVLALLLGASACSSMVYFQFIEFRIQMYAKENHQLLLGWSHSLSQPYLHHPWLSHLLILLWQASVAGAFHDLHIYAEMQ